MDSHYHKENTKHLQNKETTSIPNNSSYSQRPSRS
uniref:Uncharacterized protein n=1 Tax=Anguilla anguilla TaxID=7936 RepID=A0A0E9PH66_ANGAN